MSLPLLLWAFVACDGESAPAAPPPSRVDAVMAKPQKAVDLAGFCEVLGTGDSARSFAWPELDAPAPPEGEGWRWVNVWATWCGPCVEEMPLLAKWEAQLQGEGVNVDVQFVSVDDKADVVEGYRKSHPDTPASSRVKEYAKVAPWVSSLGLAPDSGIPIHVFVDPDDRIRCVRTGSMGPNDYKTIKQVMKSG